LKLNLRVSINGPSSPYTFQYELYDPRSYLQAGVEITQFDVMVYGIKAPIYGNGVEKIEFWLEDNSLIQDLAGNHLSEGKINGNLNKYEYISNSKLDFNLK
jgi:hypothetical protein